MHQIAFCDFHLYMSFMLFMVSTRDRC